MTGRPVRDMLIFWYAIVLHVTLAGLLLLSRDPHILATPVATFTSLTASVPFPVAAGVLLAAAAIAMWTVLGSGPWWGLVPQHCLLILSASDSAWAILRGEYADGVTRSWVFIAADQAPNLLLMLAYTVAAVEHAIWSYRVRFRAWPHWVVGTHLLMYACLLSVAAVAWSAETRISARQVGQIVVVQATTGIVEVDRYRLAQVEQRMEEASQERRWIMGLLLSNLVALLASMVTFIVKSRLDERRPFSGPDRRGDAPDRRA